MSGQKGRQGLAPFFHGVFLNQSPESVSRQGGLQFVLQHDKPKQMVSEEVTGNEKAIDVDSSAIGSSSTALG